MELVARGLFERPAPGEPGQFAWGDPDLITSHLEDAGFTEPEVETVEFTFDFADLDEWWDVQLSLSPMLGETIGGITPADRDELRDALDERLSGFVGSDGGVSLPAATHVAAADA